MSAPSQPASGSATPPTSPPSPPPPPPPPYPYYPYAYAPPSRPRDNTTTLIVLLIVALVVIPAILGAVFFFFIFGLVGTPPAFGPLVVLDDATLVAGNVTIPIRLISQEYPIGNFHFQLEVNGTTSADGAFAGSGLPTSMTVSGNEFRVAWWDLDVDGAVSGGDAFTVSGNGVPLPPDTSFTFTLSFGESILDASESWTTS